MLWTGADGPGVWDGAVGDVPTPGNFYVNLPPLFLGHFSPIFARFSPVFSPFAPSFPQDSGNGRQDPEKRSVTVEKTAGKKPQVDINIARSRYDKSRELGFPLTGGSSIPVYYREPSIEVRVLPFNSNN